MNKAIADKMELFMKEFKCIERGCDGNGTIPERDGQGDWEPAQCEFCYTVRFPLRDFLQKALQEVYELGREDHSPNKSISTFLDSYAEYCSECLVRGNYDPNVFDFFEQYLKLEGE